MGEGLLYPQYKKISSIELPDGIKSPRPLGMLDLWQKGDISVCHKGNVHLSVQYCMCNWRHHRAYGVGRQSIVELGP